MIKTRLYFTALALIFAAASSCDKYEDGKSPFENAVYLDVSATREVQVMTFKKTLQTLDKDVVATLAFPADKDVAVSLRIAPDLVAAYNAKYGTNLTMLDKAHYNLPRTHVTIKAANAVSEPIRVHFKKLDELEIDRVYLCPVTISGADIKIMGGSATTYYLVKRSSALTTAASLRDNWITFPEMDKAGAVALRYSNLSAVTYEAIVRVDDYTKNPEVSSVVGVEQYLLLRIGDANFNREQAQFDGSGAGLGKFPKKDGFKLLGKGEWYHLAATYDQNAKVAQIYVNGKLQSEGTELGASVPKPINLAMRGLYAFYEAEPDNEDYKDYSAFNSSYQFFIGRSYNDTRPLNGDIAEVRVWNVARTAEQIWDNMYEIADPENEATLLGYWKFDEGEGDVVYDRTGNGNDGIAAKPLEWPDGIEIPKVNEE